MNIVVTGASRGIGYELVKKFSLNNGTTVFAVSRNQQKLEQLQQECFVLNKSSNVVPIVCDLSSDQSVANFISQLKKHVTVVDVVVNNAGAILNKPFLEITTQELEYVYNVNVFSVVRLIQNLLPLMNEDKKSHIVNISSMGGFQGVSKFAGLSGYSSSKAALVCLTECLAEEFKNKNIAFNCLALGAVQTEMLNEAFPGYQAPILPEQMAEYICDFSLTAQQFMNGKIIPISLSTP